MLTRQTKKKTTESLNNFYLRKHISLSIHSCVSTIKFSRISRLRATFWQLVDGRLIKNFSPLFWQMRAAEGEDEEISEAAPICHEWLNKISFYIVFHSWEGETREKIWRHGTRRTSRCWLMIFSFARAARELTNSIYALICQMPSRCFCKRPDIASWLSLTWIILCGTQSRESVIFICHESASLGPINAKALLKSRNRAGKLFVTMRLESIAFNMRTRAVGKPRNDDMFSSWKAKFFFSPLGTTWTTEWYQRDEWSSEQANDARNWAHSEFVT